MKKFLAAAGMSLMLVSAAAFAVPSAQQVERAMAQGNWQQADTELSQVLEAHPNSAHAHYLYGQVLDREGRYAEALSQIEQAKSLDPQVRFTNPANFAQVEARIRSHASQGGAVPQPRTTSSTSNPFAQTQAIAPQTSQRHGPSMAAWVGIVLLFAVIALVLRWTLRRARSSEDSRADEDRRAQLKRATDLLNAVRQLKLDVRLSAAPGHEALANEVEGAEIQLRQLVESLSNAKNPVPPYQIEALEKQVASLQARAEGRPDPNAAPAPGQSAYAQEAERFGQPQPAYAPPQQQPTVVVQQGGGFGGGMGGLLTGVLLGEALSGSRERVIERDVIVDDETRRREAGGAGNGSIDFGTGSNDWNDGGSGSVDMGNNDDSGGWTDT
ncbi:tetratricopeptide repeat protein [Trinickia terrae]|uniref:Tetratricopeptide repeat protein n=1 Tax=Trinickia terrae TaxID=2571161 RepID=A0A4U1I1X1_9BURK|nr:tetratricopeptide repeat protein [Trinickia terrae]TKC87189.1 tetratricopeptide repeat protein [Trinickia terrae]